MNTPYSPPYTTNPPKVAYDGFGQLIRVGNRVGCMRGDRRTGRFAARLKSLTGVEDVDGKHVPTRAVVVREHDNKTVWVYTRNLVRLAENS